MNERAPQFRDMKNDEDTLIVFVLRLVQLCQKRYRWSSPVNTTSIELEEGKAVSLSTIRFGIPDSDELVSHLAVIRQFWLQSEPINHSNVTSILLNIARLRADVETRERIKALRQSFKREFYAGSFKFVQGDTSVELSSEELVNFWLNTFYFHTDFDHLRAARVIIGSDFTRDFARQQFTWHLNCFLRYVNRLGLEALEVLWTGIPPEGSLHFLLLENTREEIKSILTRNNGS